MKVLIDGQTLGTPEMTRGIGQVFRRIVDGMVTHEISVQWYIAVRDLAWLDHFPPQVRQSLCPVLLDPLEASGPQTEWCRAYGAQLQQLHQKFHFDVYWNVNPLMINVHFPIGLRGLPVVCTLHDLIPAVFPDKYYGEWRQDLVDDYKLRLSELGEHAHTIMCVSSHSAVDFKRLLPQAKANVVVGALASDFTRMWPLAVGSRLSNPPYLLYVGGFDPRKNMAGAVRAFAKFYQNLPVAEEQRPILRIVCSHDNEQRVQILADARELGVEHAIDLTGYVDDDRLGQLFRGANLFFFPSLYEGFGLPVLDALACGVPVVASNNSSIPEVCSGYAYLFDVDDDDDIVAKLSAAWLDRSKRPDPWLENVDHSRGFHWSKTCGAYLDVFRHVGAGTLVNSRERVKIAYLSPWPPQKNGIADYSYALIGELSQLADVTVFTPADTPTPLTGVTIKPIAEYRNHAHEFGRAIYHIGNGLDHSEIYRCAWDVPGVVVIHDYNVHPFTQHGYLFKGEREFYKEILLSYGSRGEAAWAEVESGGYADIWEFPMTEPLVARSSAAVVHSRWVADRLSNGRTPVLASHHGTRLSAAVSDGDRKAALKSLSLDESQFYVGVFGFINKNKRVDVTMKAVAHLRSEGYPVSLLLVGEANDADIDLNTWAAEFGLPGHAWHHTSFVSQDDFLKYMSATDVIVNLRFPTMGESSGSLFNSFALGKACIVSNLAQFAELPNSVAWKCDLDEFELPQLTAYLRYLLENPSARQQLAHNAYRFAAEFATFKESARTYLQAATLAEGLPA